MKLNKTTVVLLAAGLLTTAVQADEKGRGPGKGRPEARGKGGERPDRGAAMTKALGLNEKQALQMKKLQEDIHIDGGAAKLVELDQLDKGSAEYEKLYDDIVQVGKYIVEPKKNLSVRLG